MIVETQQPTTFLGIDCPAAVEAAARQASHQHHFHAAPTSTTRRSKLTARSVPNRHGQRRQVAISRTTQLKYFSGSDVDDVAGADQHSDHRRGTGLTFARLTNLQTLHLSDTKVSDRGLGRYCPPHQPQDSESLENQGDGRGNEEAACRWPTSNWLLLSDTAITDAGLDTLAGMKQLHRLTINKTKVTPAAIERLKKAIPSYQVDQ